MERRPIRLALLLALALGLAAGGSMREAAVLANHAAGIVVGKVGTACVSAAELLDALAVTGGQPS